VPSIIQEHRGFWGQIWKLARLDIKKRFKGSFLGSAWAIVGPFTTLMLFWFVFTIGLRAGGDINGVPFFQFLMVGLVAWYFMRDMLNQGARTIRQNSQYVTKIHFPVSTIMTFSAISYAIVHLMLLACVYLYLVAMGNTPSLYHLQFFIYFPLMFIFFLAVTWTLAPWVVYSRDLQNLISSVMTAVFWLSGILWNSYDLGLPWLKKLMIFNPVTFFVNGYRKTFLYHEWIWERPIEVYVFLGILAITIAFGVYNYKRLRKDMADVL